MKISEIISEAEMNPDAHWRHDQQKFFDVTGLTQRLKNDPVARLGYEIAKNPKTGVIDAISDKGTYHDPKTGAGTAGEFTYNKLGSGTVKNIDKLTGQSTPLTRDLSVGSIPPRTATSSGYVTNPTPDLENYAEVLAHELGHVGSLYTHGVAQADRTKMSKDEIAKINQISADNEEGQRYRDIMNTGSGSTQFKGSTEWLARNKFNTPVTQYSDYDDFAKQIIGRGIPQHVKDTEQSAINDLNTPEKIQNYIQDYHSDKKNESLREHKMNIKEILSEAANPAQQAAIAINMKKHGKKPKHESVVSEADATDTVTMDVPLLLRIMEYAREDAKVDMDLHHVAEKMIELSKNHDYLCMDNYNEIVGGTSHDKVTEAKKKKGPKPTNPSLWSRAKSAARSKFDVYPSAYANAWAAKWYKSKGGGWRS